MKLTIHEMRDDYGLLEFEEVNYSFLNSLRRALISLVPCLGIHEVDFHMGALGSWTDEEGEEHEYESLSAMFNEILAHRLGMLPVPTDSATLQAFGAALDDPAQQPEIMYSLNKQWSRYWCSTSTPPRPARTPVQCCRRRPLRRARSARWSTTPSGSSTGPLSRRLWRAPARRG